MKELNFKLKDGGDANGEVTGSVKVNENYIDIGIDGFKTIGGNNTISLELYEGRLMLRIWDNPEEEDCGQSIELNEVLEEYKKHKK